MSNKLKHWTVVSLISIHGKMEEYSFNLLHEDSDLFIAKKEAKKLLEKISESVTVHSMQLTEDPYFVLSNSAQSAITYGRKEGKYTGYYKLPEKE